MERAILIKVLVIIAVLAIHIEAAGHEQNGGSRPSRPRLSSPSRPIQQPSTKMDGTESLLPKSTRRLFCRVLSMEVRKLSRLYVLPRITQIILSMLNPHLWLRHSNPWTEKSASLTIF